MGEARSATGLRFHIRTDERGEKFVEVPLRVYEEMLERIEDAEDLAIIRERENDPIIPWEEMKKRLRSNEPA